MFNIGQKVVCIYPKSTLVLNQIYTIENIRTCACGVTSLSFFDLPNLPNWSGLTNMSCCGITIYGNWKKSSRFRPLDESFTEETIAMLNEHFKEQSLCTSSPTLK